MVDDASGGEKLVQLRVLWDKVIQEGTNLGYFVNESKFWFIFKEP